MAMKEDDGGGFVPPGMDAKAEPVETARRAAENARVRNLRDMIYGSRAQMR
jgi:hypothetical protein